MRPETQILLATYNGAKFLGDQLTSILRQDYTDWEILVRDDGSTDATVAILEKFEQDHPGKMTIIRDSNENLGPTPNFLRLMGYSTANVICFADQDDIWHPDKMARSVACLEGLEERHGSDTPALVHHDVATMDEVNDITAMSYAQETNSDKSNTALNHLLIQNVVTGFTATVNRALVDKALPAPEDTTTHDGYLGLVAATFGEIGYIDDQLANYRIHKDNVWGGKNPFYAIGSSDFSLRNLFNGHTLRLSIDIIGAAHNRLKEKCVLASTFLERHRDEMEPEAKRIFEDFARLADATPLTRKALIIKNGFFPTSPKLAVAFLALG